MTFTVASSPEEIKIAIEIRKKIFVDEQGIPTELDSDGDDERSIHLLARTGANNMAIGTGRLTMNGMQGTLSRICVIESHRNKGVAKQIVNELETIARHEGALTLSLTPHKYLQKFYESLGYSATGHETEVGKYKLLVMTKRV